MATADGGNIFDAAGAAGVPTAKAMGGGMATTALGWAISNQGLAVFGFGLTVAGFIVNLIFQIRRDRRAEEWQQAQLDVLRHPDRED